MFFPKKIGLPTCKVEEFPSIGINEQLCKFMRDYQKDEHLGKDFSFLKSIHVKIIPLLKKKKETETPFFSQNWNTCNFERHVALNKVFLMLI